MPWTFDPATRTYRETDTGQTLSEAQLRPIARSFLNAALVRTRELTGELANNLLTVPEWEVEMRRIVKETFGAAYTLSRGGRESMAPSDWGRLGQLARRQYQFLNEYAQDIEGAGLTRDRALSRSDLYVQSARQAYERGKLATFADMPRLERVPGSGASRCISNCRCSLDISETDEGWEVYWLDLSDERECVDCQRFASEWAPLKLARAAQTTTPREESPA